MSKIPAILCLLTLGLLPMEARIFNMKNGARVDASILGYEENNVILKVKGKKYEIPFPDFSKDDQDYLLKYAPHLEANPGDPQAEGSDPGQAKPGDPASKTAGEGVLKPNWDAPWPGNITGPDDLEIIEEAADPVTKEFVYLSPHYRFVCDVRLTTSVVRSFARLFEATHASMSALPFHFCRARISDPNKRHKILLFETEETYFKNGGPPGSAGVFVGGRDGGDVMVPLTSLGVKPMGSGYTRDRKKSNRTLPHELVHQLTDYEYYALGSRGWFTEGLAEFVALSQMTDSRFNFERNLDEIVAYATAHGKDGQGGRAIGEEVRIEDLKAFMLMPYSRFTADANFNYAVGMLLTTHFIYFDDKGSRKNVVAFLKAMREGTAGEELLDILKVGRTWEQLTDEITSAWRRKGVKFEFGKTGETADTDESE